MSRFVTVLHSAFVLWWVTLILVYAVTAAPFSFFAYLYEVVLVHKLNYLAVSLRDCHIGPARDTFPTITVFLGLTAPSHGLAILRMLAASLFYRSFAFLIEPHDLKTVIYRLLGLKLGPDSASVITLPTQARSLLDRLFGVDGKYFYLVLFCREIGEMSLQTS
uniref:Uncharacterized protein n=1 Tax=Globisporangium ultimum (strain ATCC 200006 / CBS 805.95 / DAOM BR144) TaxID=431595 RepID=K3WGM0_GLOUD